jgi:hypothetical protein
MSPAAIEQRMRELAQLYRLGIMLENAKRIGPVCGSATVGDTNSTSGFDEPESQDRPSGESH